MLNYEYLLTSGNPMRRFFIFPVILSAILFADGPLYKTGQTTCYDPVAHTQITCSGTGQDGEYQVGESHIFFRDDTIGVVSDFATNLQWQDNYADNNDTIPLLSWNDAVAYCQNLTLNAGGWRMPTFRELWGLIQIKPTAPMIDTDYFHFTENSYYAFWTSDAPDDSPMIIYFSNAQIEGYYSSKSNQQIIRCVHDGIVTNAPELHK